MELKDKVVVITGSSSGIGKATALRFALDEVADAFIFLAKNDAMTGQIIYVDGGFTLK